ncbi:MAG: hypothetical protein JXQ96_10520 [Cyclobacteriaceae bacterium]
MNLSHVNRFILFGGFLIIAFSSSFHHSKDELKYMQSPTIDVEYKQRQTLVVEYKDSLSADPFYFVKTKDGLPLHYFKDIVTEVCFDSECRLLEVRVYWNITGRYLGFELPKGEFLSKHDHEPFVAEEYERLNDLLADPDLPLGNISFEKLIELPESEEESVDGVSGATSVEVSKMVVKGAAYTTYTLWNIVHGPTQDLVESITEQQLSPKSIELIVKSPDITDRAWALNRIDQNIELNPALTSSLINIISGDDFFLSYTAINAIKPAHLNSEAFQIALFSCYKEAGHSIKKMIVEKLMEAPELSFEVVEKSRDMLSILNGQQLKTFLSLYSKFDVRDLETCRVVAGILKNENSFVSRQAYAFLKGQESVVKEISLLLQEYVEKTK